jgi:hypothetical protein
MIEVYNGIHPGVPLIGHGANENRFDVLIDNLMPEEWSSNKINTNDYHWARA